MKTILISADITIGSKSTVLRLVMYSAYLLTLLDKITYARLNSIVGRL